MDNSQIECRRKEIRAAIELADITIKSQKLEIEKLIKEDEQLKKQLDLNAIESRVIKLKEQYEGKTFVRDTQYLERDGGWNYLFYKVKNIRAHVGIIRYTLLEVYSRSREFYTKAFPELKVDLLHNRSDIEILKEGEEIIPCEAIRDALKLLEEHV
jgi:hypothetical protein